MPQKVYLTKENLEKIKKQLEELKTIKRREIAERIQEAKDLGDLSENAEYGAAKNEQSFNEGKIQELENTLRNAEIIENRKQGDNVLIGSTVRILINSDYERSYSITGDSDIDPSQGKISHRSPLGQALLGKKVNGTGEVKTPKGTIRFKIVSIA